MSRDLSNNHPIIPNSNQYFFEKKYISIHSEDRDISKFVNSSEFEISLPQEYLNVVSARLSSWSFPANYNVFSITTHNTIMSFKFNHLYNPGEYNVKDILLESIFAVLYNNIDNEYIFSIEPGFYNPDQMATELTNKMNEAVTIYINTIFSNNPTQYADAIALFKSYTRFTIVYNSVQQKLWFGNGADKFILSNDSLIYFKHEFVDSRCVRRRELPDFSSWGLPAFLGFTRCPTEAYTAEDIIDLPLPDPSVSPLLLLPRFYYGDAKTDTGDNGFWIFPSAPQSKVYFLQAPLKINFMGQAYIYMEIDGMNCIDETSPWNLSEYTIHNTQTNGIANSSFAKIPVPTTPISQWFDNNMAPYKYWNPPAERISKLKVKFRYHNGKLVEFGNFEYSFTIEFNLLKSQQERTYSIRNAFDLAQHQSF